MRHRFVLFLLGLAAVLLPGAARGVPCSPLQCGSLSTPLPGGALAARPGGLAGPLRVYDLVTGRRMRQLPPGVLAANGRRHFALLRPTAVGYVQTVVGYDVRTGHAVSREVVGASWSLAGVSGDGRTAVLMRREDFKTEFSVRGQHPQTIKLPGNFDFDALAGDKLFLIENREGGYVVRLYDLARGRLDPQPLTNGDEPSLIQGLPWTRLATPDGLHVYTLYVPTGNGEAMIHSLDLRTGRAVCIDLPNAKTWPLATSYALAVRGSTLYAASGPAGAVVEIAVDTNKVLATTRIPATRPRPASSTAPAPNAAVAPDGSQLAFSDGGTSLRRFDLHTRAVVSTTTVEAKGLGYAPNGRLWIVSGAGLRPSP